MFGNKESKEEKKAKKEQELLNRYGLNELNNSSDIESVKKIVAELAGTGMMETGMALSFNAKPEDTLPVYYQRAILEQNFIIIRQLDRISKALDRQ